MSQTVYDQAHALVGAIRQSDAYRRYHSLKSEIDGDSEARQRLQEFREQQIAAQAAQFMGRGLQDSEQARMQDLHAMISQAPRLKAFVQAEAELLQMMVDVQKIVGESVQLFDDMAEALGKFPWPGFGGDE